MKRGKNSGERLLEEILKLDTVEFLGVCKILGIKLVEETTIGPVKDVEDDEECGRAVGHVDVNIEPRQFEAIWCDMCDKLETMNRTQRRNLGKLVYAATKKGKEDE